MPNIQYFLGANSPRGFYSLYDQLIRPEDAQGVYILKGSPGCGKSTLMRRVGRAAEERGLAVEYIRCSGDPASLDAVLLPSLSVAVVDGTAPHVIEPKYPCLVEHYVNLGACCNSHDLAASRQEIMDSMVGYKGCYQRVYRCLDAAARIAEDIRATLLSPALEEKMARRAAGILSREARRQKGHAPGRVTQRFLSAVTCEGTMRLYETAQAQCSKIYELTDRYGLAHSMLTYLLSGFTRAGYDVVACPCPMAPERLEHLLVPQLGLGFLSTCPAFPFPGRPYRRIRLDAMVDGELLRRSRSRLRFSQKVFDCLVEEAVTSLQQAKAMHDELEALYHPHMDFDRVNVMADEIIQAILP